MSETPAQNLPMPEVDVTEVDAMVARLGGGGDSTIPLLQAVQARWNYLPEAALRRICECTAISPGQLMGVATFYDQFRLLPAGRHLIQVCDGTACHVKGAMRVYDALRRHLGLTGDDDTDRDRLFTVQTVACLGCCTLAPVVRVGVVTFGHMTPAAVPETLASFLAQQNAAMSSAGEIPAQTGGGCRGIGEVRIGLGSCCQANGSSALQAAIAAVLAEAGLPAVIKSVSCSGMCHQTPLMEIVTATGESFLYARVKPDDVAGLVLKHFRPESLVHRCRLAAERAINRLVFGERSTAAPLLAIAEQPVVDFLGSQRHLATANYGELDPLDLDDYRRRGGFTALQACLSRMSPEQVVAEVSASGLRGRGGGGFPTGRKWATVRAARGSRKYVICNGDEGDPGAFMDRMLLESYPYRVLEGMAIAAFATGVREGMLYIRAEYPLAVTRVREALRRCVAAGLLGENVCGSNFALSLRIMEGAGAFVCGEETAMIASIEGGRGMPHYRPPFPAEAGLYNCPTLVNNCESFALVPWIVANGASAFATIGTVQSPGTKVFALAGKVARGGLIEVPMGISLRQIVETIGGGVPDGRSFKAVQIGGPSGGCLPAALADTPVDYEALGGVGAMMGSGGLVVLDDRDCMVEMARYFVSFTQAQSCGKCTFCRVGTRRMLDVLERLCAGHGRMGDLEELERLALAVKAGSLCGLGKTAPNPVLTTLRYFRDEYDAHLAGRCPAGQCKALIRYGITDRCIGCTLCAQRCPVEAIALRPYQQHLIDQALCIRCGTCHDVCPEHAVQVASPGSV